MNTLRALFAGALFLPLTLGATELENLRPIFECWEPNGTESYIAHFGYRNDNATTVNVPVGANNKFTPSPEDRGQPTSFEPGRTPFWPSPEFSVEFDGSNLVWKLGNRTATASTNGPRCQRHVFFEKLWVYGKGRLSDFPPLDLSPEFYIQATSSAGTATCSYIHDVQTFENETNDVPSEGPTLVCDYRDTSNNPTEGLIVPSGETYAVEEYGLPEGWKSIQGEGEFDPADEQVCEPGRDELEKNCTHLIKNRKIRPKVD